MKISDVIKNISDMVDSTPTERSSGDNTSKFTAFTGDLTLVELPDGEDEKRREPGKMPSGNDEMPEDLYLPPLQLKSELLKKAVDVENVFDDGTPAVRYNEEYGEEGWHGDESEHSYIGAPQTAEEVEGQPDPNETSYSSESGKRSKPRADSDDSDDDSDDDEDRERADESLDRILELALVKESGQCRDKEGVDEAMTDLQRKVAAARVATVQSRQKKLSREKERRGYAPDPLFAKKKKPKNGDVEELEELFTDTPKSYKNKAEHDDCNEGNYHDADFVDKSDKYERLRDLAKRMGDKEKFDHYNNLIKKLYGSDHYTTQGDWDYKKISEWDDYDDEDDEVARGDRELARMKQFVNPAKFDADDSFTVSIDDEEEQLNELSKGTLGSYVKKAGRDLPGRALASDALVRAGRSTDNKEHRRAYSDMADREYGRELSRKQGIDRAVDRLTRESDEQLDELSKGTLGSYVKKAGHSVGNIGHKLGQQRATSDEVDRFTNRNMSDKYDTRDVLKKQLGASSSDQNDTMDKFGRRTKGIDRAVDRLTRESDEQLSEEAKEMNRMRELAGLNPAVLFALGDDDYPV